MEPLVDLLIMWCGVFLAIIAARHTRLTPVLYFLFFGFLLTNLGILTGETDPFIRSFAEIGIIVIMFAIGFEENTDNFLSGMKRSWGIAFFGAVGPFLTAYFTADYFWGSPSISLMCGLTMTATAVSLTLASLKSEGLHKSKAATGIMTSAVLDDIASLALVAILVPVATGDAPANTHEIIIILAKVIAFFVGVIVLGTWILPHRANGIIARIPILGTMGFQHLFRLLRGEHNTLIVLAFAVAIGLAAHALGFHPAVGAYMAGLVLKEEYFFFSRQGVDEEETEHFEATKEIVDDIAFSWIGPIFFIDLGTKIVFDITLMSGIVPQIAILTLGVLTVQIFTAGMAARYTGGFSGPESLMIGIGMVGRAELAFVVMDIAYIQNSILSAEAFYTLMATAFLLNISVPIMIALWKRTYGT